MEEKIPFSVTGEQEGVLVDMDKVWIHAGHQRRLYNSPVFRVLIHVTDVAGPTSPYKTWGGGGDKKAALLNHSAQPIKVT